MNYKKIYHINKPYQQPLANEYDMCDGWRQLTEFLWKNVVK